MVCGGRHRIYKSPFTNTLPFFCIHSQILQIVEQNFTKTLGDLQFKTSVCRWCKWYLTKILVSPLLFLSLCSPPPSYVNFLCHNPYERTNCFGSLKSSPDTKISTSFYVLRCKGELMVHIKNNNKGFSSCQHWFY